MLDSTAKLINSPNYNANFGYTKPELPNETFQDNPRGNLFIQTLEQHYNRVSYVWFTDTGIEIDGRVRSLRTIATSSFGVSDTLAYDIDDLILSHDRSSYSDDEFYPVLNNNFPVSGQHQDYSIYSIAQIKHIQRNPHHLGHYIVHQDDGQVILGDMPIPFLCEMLADWIAYGRQPYEFYWGNPEDDEDRLYAKIPMSSYTRSNLQRMVGWWEIPGYWDET